MTRSDLLNALIQTRHYQSYLEIGVNTPKQPGYNWDNIKIALKHGVDPNVETDFKMTSDKFFARHIQRKYDLIFIDGLHFFEQVHRDITNSLKWLNSGGTIVVHDCNPTEELTQRRERASEVWHGDVWKAILKLRTDNLQVSIFTVDTDEGCSVITKGKQKLFITGVSRKESFSYSYFDAHRKEILNLISVAEFEQKLYGRKPPKRITVGILLVATGKYISYADQFISSSNKYFLSNAKFRKIFYIFTDSTSVPDGAIKIYKEFKDFPHPTLTRYHSFCGIEDELKKTDYLFYCDVDMKFVAPVSEEIIGETMGTIHPGYFASTLSEYPYERNPRSKAFIAEGAGKMYFCGGFNGGRMKSFLKMAKTLRNNIDADLKKGIVARVHDESHLNRYFATNPPKVILSPSYCYPEGLEIPFAPKLVALNKNHALVRYSGIKMITCFSQELVGRAIHQSWLQVHFLVLFVKRTVKTVLVKMCELIIRTLRLFGRIQDKFKVNQAASIFRLFTRIRNKIYTEQAALLYSQVTVSESFHFNCLDLPLSDPNVLDLVTMAFNNDFVIKEQIKFLKKNLIDRFVYTVIDNSTIPQVREKIASACRQNKVGYIYLPHQGDSLVPSSAHGLVINWTYKNYLRPRRADYFGIVDSDIYPIKKTSVIESLKKFPVYGWLQERREKWYLWPGLAFYRTSYLPSGDLNFMPCDGLDTGGGNWSKIYSHLDKSRLTKLDHSYNQINGLRTKKIDGPQIPDLIKKDQLVEFIGDWVHTFNSSNWRQTGNKNSKVRKLLSTIASK